MSTGQSDVAAHGSRGIPLVAQAIHFLSLGPCCVSVLGAGDMELPWTVDVLPTVFDFLGFPGSEIQLVFLSCFCPADLGKLLAQPFAYLYLSCPDVFLDCPGGSQQPLWGLQPRKRLFVGDAWLFATKTKSPHQVQMISTERKNATDESGPSH